MAEKQCEESMTPWGNFEKSNETEGVEKASMVIKEAGTRHVRGWRPCQRSDNCP